MKIKEVVEEVAAGKVDVLFESSLREMDAGEKTRRIQVCYERRTYWIEYVDEMGKRVVKRISRSRESLGKMYVVNRLNSFMDPGVPERSDKLDYTVELTREKLLYSGEMGEMEEMGEKEGRRLKEWIESGGERDERIVVEEEVEREQLEMSVVEKVVDGPEVGLTKFYYEQSWISNEDNLSAFDRIFSSLWKQYSKW
ncbi:hypothetical protein ECANGB1_985 [Enterospora canceri]|uniref:Uncharacterized protein n=1 Tax=Enterospora canceri TaxID=1081671 RepID=A0A1Y1S4V2_9MICR|nr:hypothetical protein ECANGB1_985 [Enterospora canceri]